MEPLSVIVGALTAGAAAAGKDVVTQAVKDAYGALKQMVVTRFGTKADVANAMQQVEQKPDSEGRQAVLKEELKSAGAHEDPDVAKQAQTLLALLKDLGLIDAARYQAYLSGSGAIAQGTGAVAAGQGGIAIGGSVSGNISTPGQGSAK
jgi:hypothetical protein